MIVKLANYALERRGVLLGYGVEFGLPTGDAHGHGGRGEHQGHDHGAGPEEDVYEIAPFLNAGWTSGPWEAVGWTPFEIPTNQDHQESVGTALRYNTSLLHHTSSRIELLVEAFGGTGLSGRETDRATANVAPGLRLRPLEEGSLVIGAGVAFPLAADREFDHRALISAFYHF